jgi:hypothetical protein
MGDVGQTVHTYDDKSEGLLFNKFVLDLKFVILYNRCKGRIRGYDSLNNKYRCSQLLSLKTHTDDGVELRNIIKANADFKLEKL